MTSKTHNKTKDLRCLTTILYLLDEIEEQIEDGEGKFDQDLLNEACWELDRRVLGAIHKVTGGRIDPETGDPICQ